MNEGRHFLVSYHYANLNLHPSQVKGVNALGFKNRILYSDDGQLTTAQLVQWERLLRDYYTEQHSGNPEVVFLAVTRLDD